MCYNRAFYCSVVPAKVGRRENRFDVACADGAVVSLAAPSASDFAGWLRVFAPSSANPLQAVETRPSVIGMPVKRILQMKQRGVLTDTWMPCMCEFNEGTNTLSVRQSNSDDVLWKKLVSKARLNDAYLAISTRT